MGAALEIRNLHVSVEDKPILRGVDLTVKQGEVHALMGPNGSGKSTLANVLLGNPAYAVTGGQIIFDGEDLLEMEPDERSRAGLVPRLPVPDLDSRRDAGELPAAGDQCAHESGRPGQQGHFGDAISAS